MKPPAPAWIRWTFGSLDGVGCDDVDDSERVGTSRFDEAEMDSASVDDKRNWLAAIASLGFHASFIVGKI